MGSFERMIIIVHKVDKFNNTLNYSPQSGHVRQHIELIVHKRTGSSERMIIIVHNVDRFNNTLN